MAAPASGYPLTERNLALHDELLQSHISEAVTQWVAKVITEERIHQFYSQLSATITNLHPNSIDIELDMDHLDQRISSSGVATTHQGNALASLKLFEQRPYTCFESPLERFLTPGASDVSYFCRPALSHMEIQFGSMEGVEERRIVACANVDLVRDRARRACELAEIALY